MVAIRNIALFSTIATMAMAAPAASADVVARDTTELTNAELEAIVNSSYGLEKRAVGDLVYTVLGLLANIGTFLGQTLNNVLTLNLSAESDALTNLLIGVNAQILQLSGALNGLGPLSGLGGLLQKLLINTGVASTVLALSTTVSTLVAKILKNGGNLSDAQKAAFTTLQATISALYNTLQNQGLGAGSLGPLQDILGKIGSIL